MEIAQAARDWAAGSASGGGAKGAGFWDPPAPDPNATVASHHAVIASGVTTSGAASARCLRIGGAYEGQS